MNDRIPRTARAKRPRYLDERANDTLLAMVLTLAQELSVTQDRVDTLEQVLAANGGLTAEQLAAFRPDPATDAARQARRRAMLDRLTRTLTESLDNLPDAS